MEMWEAISWNPSATLWENVIEDIFLNTTKRFSEELPLKQIENKCHLITQLTNILFGKGFLNID